MPSWREALAESIAEEARPREKFGHQPRLYALTQAIGQGSVYDDDVVFAASYLHDLGVFFGHRPEDPITLASWNNVTYAMTQAPEILLNLGFPEPKIPSVLEAIRTHQPRFVPSTLEATILRDADILEQLGAIGILRTVCKVGRDTRFHTFTEAIASLRRALDELPPLLTLSQSKLLAEPRVLTLRTFLEATQSEAGSLLL